MSCIKIIYGSGSAGSWRDEKEGSGVLNVLEEFGVDTIDTARIYASSEELIGKRGAADRFEIDTKHPGGFAQNTPATKENVIETAEVSLGLLKTDQVHIYYLHAPDRTTPLKDTLAGIDELYKQGRFRRFGLSNFLANEVEEVIHVAAEHGFVRPSVYQGNYSAFARRHELELFPVLRKHGMAFNAYSPLAGGFLTKTAKDVEDQVGRFTPANPLGEVYVTLYKKPVFLAALEVWEAISQASRVPKAELAYRWVAYHSSLTRGNGDGMIVGARNLQQLRETLTGLRRGPLPDDVAKQIEAIWDQIKDEAGLDNFNLNSA
ncbi:aldehyde reductase [Seiridium cupressi]